MKAGEDPRVAVIVVGYNSERHVAALLRSLPAGVRPYRPTLCLVDNHSDDRTAALFEEHGRQWPHGLVLGRTPANLGYTGGNNLALQLLATEGPFDFYVLVNPDTVVQEGWLDGLLRHFADPTVGTVGSVQLLPDGRVDAIGCGLHFLGFGFMLGFETRYVDGPGPSPSYVCGAALAISRECRDRVQSLSGESGLFWPELHLYHDDLDLGWRVLLAGYRPLVAPQSRLVHHHDFEGGPGKFFYMERNRFLVLACNYRWRTLLLLMPLLFFAELALVATDRRLGLRGRLRVYASVLRELASRRLWRRRRLVQGRRVRSDREILGHLFGSIQHPEMKGGRSVFNRLSLPVFALLRPLVRW